MTTRKLSNNTTGIVLEQIQADGRAADVVKFRGTTKSNPHHRRSSERFQR